MIRKDKALYYADYLNLPTLTSLQQTESAKVGNEAHDETLFIVVHQVYELWFKQILHELKSILKIVDTDELPEQNLSICNDRLERIIQIQHLLT